MVIQHNMSAMYTSNTYGVILQNLAKGTEKLSSGYRINRAADDASGLAISEKMRAQIRMLNQASFNAQDGISMVQTAEGSLNEVHDMIQRIRELSVKAANGTNAESDRQAIQAEIDQLAEEINRTSENTEFNDRKLLDGSCSADPIAAGTADGRTILMGNLYGSWLSDAAAKIEASTGWTLPAGCTLKMEVKDDLGGAVMACSGGPKNFTLHMKSELLTMNVTDSSGPSYSGLKVDQMVAHEMTHLYMMANVGSGYSDKLWFVEGLAEAVIGDSNQLGDNGRFDAGQVMSNVHANVNGLPNGAHTAYPGGFLAISYLVSAY